MEITQRVDSPMLTSRDWRRSVRRSVAMMSRLPVGARYVYAEEVALKEQARSGVTVELFRALPMDKILAARVHEVFTAALAQPPHRREAFMREACDNNAALLDEVDLIENPEAFSERTRRRVRAILDRGFNRRLIAVRQELVSQHVEVRRRVMVGIRRAVHSGKSVSLSDPVE
jgi:hypothetical protein